MDDIVRRAAAMRVVKISKRHHYQARRERAAILEMVREERDSWPVGSGEYVMLESLAADIEARGDG